MTSIVGIDPDPGLLTPDMPLQVRFHERDCDAARVRPGRPRCGSCTIADSTAVPWPRW